MNTKSDCLDFLSRNLIRTADWRRVQATKYADLRNEGAAFALTQLAAQALEIKDELWDQLSRHFDPKCFRWCDAVSRASRDVGFRNNPRSFAAFVQHVIYTLGAENTK
jgi:hypothetical protein